MTKEGSKTPVRRALLADSPLQASVADGLGAVKAPHRRDHFDPAVLRAFADSLELDEAVRLGNERDNRWDYLLGHEGQREGRRSRTSFSQAG